MKVLVTGARGLVGSSLIPFLKAKGHQVVRLVRSYPEAGDLLWDPEQKEIQADQLEGFDAVVHLAGDNIASGRWTPAKKASILQSRVTGTTLLSETLASLAKPPECLISGSAIGYYGDRESEILTEESTSGAGFLAEVCREWEAATAAAKSDPRIRVAFLRTGVVLSADGGALSKMLPPFRAGVGGKLGSGKQYFSWVSCLELCSIINHIMTHRELSGPVNAVAPNAVTNEEFTHVLGANLHRPTILPVPDFAAHLLFGQMADELLLTSELVRPMKLINSGYVFRDPDLNAALHQILKAA